MNTVYMTAIVDTKLFVPTSISFSVVVATIFRQFYAFKMCTQGTHKTVWGITMKFCRAFSLKTITMESERYLRNTSNSELEV